MDKRHVDEIYLNMEAYLPSPMFRREDWFHVNDAELENYTRWWHIAEEPNAAHDSFVNQYSISYLARTWLSATCGPQCTERARQTTNVS